MGCDGGGWRVNHSQGRLNEANYIKFYTFPNFNASLRKYVGSIWTEPGAGSGSTTKVCNTDMILIAA